MSAFTPQEMEKAIRAIKGKKIGQVQKMMDQLQHDKRIDQWTLIQDSRGIGVAIKNQNGIVSYFPETTASEEARSEQENSIMSEIMKPL